MDHPSRDELTAFCREELPSERELEVLDHLLGERCPECLAVVPPPLRALLVAQSSPPTPEEDAAYDAALDRAFEAALEVDRHLRRQQAQAERAQQALAAGRPIPRNTDALAHMDALLSRSWQLRYEDPTAMADLAWAAVQVSLRLDPSVYGSERVRDHQAKAHAELGNAHRAANHFQEAEQALAEARRLFERGTRPPHLEARLLELEASLLADLRQFVPAAEKLAKVLKFYTDEDDVHLAGRTLVLIGLYTGYAGNCDLAVKRLRQSLKMIDAKRDSGLACAAAHNLILFLVDSGRIVEARKLRLLLSRQLNQTGGHVNKIKFRALEGRIDSGLGNFQRAETIFREVKSDYVEAGLIIPAGITDLDLAAVLLQQGRTREAEQIVTEAAKIFILHGIRFEAMKAVVLLRDTFDTRTVTVEMVVEVATFLRRLEIDPTLRFEARSWEE